jgi:hypothetical protein
LKKRIFVFVEFAKSVMPVEKPGLQIKYGICLQKIILRTG